MTLDDLSDHELAEIHRRFVSIPEAVLMAAAEKAGIRGDAAFAHLRESARKMDSASWIRTLRTQERKAGSRLQVDVPNLRAGMPAGGAPTAELLGRIVHDVLIWL